VGKTKRGKGTKVLATADHAGLPLAVHVEAASPHEVTLAETTLAEHFVHARPEHLIGDRVYDSDPQDGRPLRHEYHAENFRGLVPLGCIMILLRWYL
jgi:hypothetical protein